MDDSVEDPDIIVEPPEPSPAAFPAVGRSLVPTAEDLAAGRHGNGAWDLTDASIERAYAEVHEAKKAEKDERRQFFNERAKDALADAIDFHHRIVRRGLEVMDALDADPTKVTQKDMAILGMAQKSSKELADRGMGRAVAGNSEESTHTSILTLIQRKQPDA